MVKKYYISGVDLNRVVDRFNKNSLSFKYRLVKNPEFVIDCRHRPAILLELGPSGYNDPKCFNGNVFDPSKISKKYNFTAFVTDFDISGDELSNEDKIQLTKLIFDGYHFSQDFRKEYQKRKIDEINSLYSKKLRIVESIKNKIIKTKGKEYYDDYIRYIKDEQSHKIQEICVSFPISTPTLAPYKY